MYSNIKKLAASIIIAFSFLPMFALAVDTTTTSTNTVASPKANFCTRLDSVNTKLAAQVTQAETKQSKYEATRDANVAKKESSTDAVRAQSRATVDAKRAQNWDKMINKANTDVKKSAVTLYKTAITNAVNDRRNEIDQAVKTYRDGLATAMTTHTTTLDTALVTFKSGVADALAKAKADCSANVASKTVSSTFNKTINDARKTLQATRKGATGASALATLKKTRDDAVTLAETSFKQATEKAHADLLIALKK